MTFTDRHERLIGDIEISGVDADEDNEDDDDPLPGVVPAISDNIKISGVGVEGPEAQEAVPAPQVEIDDLDIPHLPKKNKRQKVQHRSHYQHRHLGSVDQQESGIRRLRGTLQACQAPNIPMQ
jgi:hypothetical protein